MFNSLRAIKLSAPIPRILLGSAIALVLALALWLALIAIGPTAQVVLAAPNDVIGGLTATNDGPKTVNTPITFTASITGGTVSTYTWDFGDGNESGAITATVTASHAYTASGIYTATVEATGISNTVTATTTVYVGDAVVTVKDFAFNPDPVTIPQGGMVVWVRLGGDHSVTADDASFNQPHSATWTVFAHKFDTDGTFPYYCTVHGGPGGSGMHSAVIVEGPPEPIEGLTAGNDSPATVNSQIIFSTTITNGNNITYTWDFGDGNTDPASADVTTTHAYTAPGIFTATVTAVNISSIVTATTTAYVGDAIVEVKDFEYDPQVTHVPPGGTVVWVLAGNTFSHSVTADDLSFNQPASTDWPPFVHTFTETMVAASEPVSITYHCTVHANMTGTVVLAAGPDPVAGLTATNDSPTQVLTPVSLSAHITGGTAISYTWDFGDGGVGTNITTTHTYTQSGIYTATVTATNATNSKSATTTVLIGDAIVDVRDFEFDPTPVTIPVGGTVIWVLRQGTHGVVANDNSFAGPTGSNWAPFVHTFNTAGTVPYHCSVHGLTMAGEVIVSESNQQLLMPQLYLDTVP